MEEVKETAQSVEPETVSPKQQKTEKDIYLVAAYLASGAKLVIGGINRDNPRQIEFSLVGPNLDELEVQWINGDMMVNAKQYAERIREVKSLIYAGR